MTLESRGGELTMNLQNLPFSKTSWSNTNRIQGVNKHKLIETEENMVAVVTCCDENRDV